MSLTGGKCANDSIYTSFQSGADVLVIGSWFIVCALHQAWQAQFMHAFAQVYDFAI